MNTTTFAIDALGLEVTAPEQPLALDNAVGIGLRRNRRRAHLLVSNLLGKHTPQRPDIVAAAARILAVRAADALAGYDQGRTAEALSELDAALSTGSPAPTTLPRVHSSTPFVVVGFAEAASALGFTFAQHLGAYYVCSTRTPQGPEYGHFEEAHSHASEHFLTPVDTTLLNDQRTAVMLVDDELTTGRTAMNTIRALHHRSRHSAYVIATLADLRSDASRVHLDAFAAELGVSIQVVSLFSACLAVPDEAVARAEDAMSAAPDAAPTLRALTTTYATQTFTAIDVPQARDGAHPGDRLTDAARDVARSVAVNAGERILVLGVEEDMTLALATAEAMQRAGHTVDFSSTTRSPAAVIDDVRYPIRDSISFTGPDGHDRFVYNVSGRYDRVIIVSSDPLYTPMLPAVAYALDGHTRAVTVASPLRLQAPLVGPAFGSYAADEVQWLLKDLSGVALEVSLEDREELVQSGAHYAESLPQEYQPTNDYMELYRGALSQNAARVATDIGIVAQRVMAARAGRPVLVSLARAGTPVGVLLRRYLATFHDYVAPHYAVSIVRGKGIDPNALRYLAAHHDPEDVIFVDGWTGKGAITRELRDALAAHEEATGQRFNADLAVLADTGDCTTIYGTRDDYLIPSAALNSTVSGLVSRTVLNDALIGPDDYHGAKFYSELAEADVSGEFVDEVTSHFSAIDPSTVPLPGLPGWSSWVEVERISEEYGIGAVNLVKPGVGETTRVLLRRVPWRVLLNPNAGDAVAHIRALAEARGVPIEEVPGLRFNAVGLIHPKFTKSATGADGLAAGREAAA